MSKNTTQKNNSQKDDRKDDHKNDNKFDNNKNNKPVVGNDCRDDRRDDHKDKDDKHDKDKGKNNCKPNIWSCDDGFYGAPHHTNTHGKGHHEHGNGNGYGHRHDSCGFETVIVETPRVFTGNTFPLSLPEDQPIGAEGQAALGQLASNMQISANTHVTGEITYEMARFESSLGAFTVGADGTLLSAAMVMPNVEGTGGTFNIETGPGAKSIGFFLVADGNNINNEYAGLDFSKGELKFITDYNLPTERAAKVTDDGANVTLVFTSETNVETVIQGPIWFTSDRGGSNSLNKDGMVHTISGVDSTDPTGETLKIAFEDRTTGTVPSTDRDYNDTVFTVKMTEEVQKCVPVCEPKPCTPPPCDVIDYGDKVSDIVSNYIQHVSSKVTAIADAGASANSSSHAAATVFTAAMNIADDHVSYAKHSQA